MEVNELACFVVMWKSVFDMSWPLPHQQLWDQPQQICLWLLISLPVWDDPLAQSLLLSLKSWNRTFCKCIEIVHSFLHDAMIMEDAES